MTPSSPMKVKIKMIVWLWGDRVFPARLDDVIQGLVALATKTQIL